MKRNSPPPTVAHLDVPSAKGGQYPSIPAKLDFSDNTDTALETSEND